MDIFFVNDNKKWISVERAPYYFHEIKKMGISMTYDQAAQWPFLSKHIPSDFDIPRNDVFSWNGKALWIPYFISRKILSGSGSGCASTQFFNNFRWGAIAQAFPIGTLAGSTTLTILFLHFTLILSITSRHVIEAFNTVVPSFAVFQSSQWNWTMTIIVTIPCVNGEVTGCVSASCHFSAEFQLPWIITLWSLDSTLSKALSRYLERFCNVNEGRSINSILPYRCFYVALLHSYATRVSLFRAMCALPC